MVAFIPPGAGIAYADNLEVLEVPAKVEISYARCSWGNVPVGVRRPPEFAASGVKLIRVRGRFKVSGEVMNPLPVMDIRWNYESTPGAAATPGRWPSASRVKPAAGRATLVMSAHPHCPCTRASIGELARLMTQAQGRVTAYVLFVKPPGFSDGWEQTDLWASAAAIPGVTPLRDDDGAEAGRFHATTSGQASLYDAAGRLLFSGGITGARGHAGDNAGRAAIVSLLATGEADWRDTPVFGCPLFAQTECQSGMEVGREKDNH